jgi:Nuclease-related domain
MSIQSVIRDVTHLLQEWKFDERAIPYILFALVIGIVIGRYRAFRAAAFQNRGEALLSRVLLTKFSPPDYHLMNHVTIRMNNGTTQIDHILVSRFGIFVIETKDYKGWIFANANQAKWTQVLFKWRFRFQNPIFQNMRHVKAVRGLLDFLPPEAIKSVVVFVGKAEFMTEIPEGVFGISDVVHYLSKQTAEVVSLHRLQFCVGRLETVRLAISGKTDVEHVQYLERRFGRTL